MSLVYLCESQLHNFLLLIARTIFVLMNPRSTKVPSTDHLSYSFIDPSYFGEQDPYSQTPK